MPGLKVLSPYSAEDHKGLLKAAIRDPDPCVFLENEVIYSWTFDVPDEVLDKNFLVPIGKAKIEMPGKHITIVSHARALRAVLEAATQLKAEGISIRMI